MVVIAAGLCEYTKITIYPFFNVNFSRQVGTPQGGTENNGSVAGGPTVEESTAG